MPIPKVFVSYSHDSHEHKDWVLKLAGHLRAAGVDAILDQWELEAGDDLPHFMETKLTESSRVLVICTKKYVEKSNLGVGGVGYEKMIVTSELIRSIASNKVIPIIKQDGGDVVLPTFLKSKIYVDLSCDEMYATGVDELIRTIHGVNKTRKPELGKNPYFPGSNKKEEYSKDFHGLAFNDAKKEILRRLIDFRISLFELYEEHLSDFQNFVESIDDGFVNISCAPNICKRFVDLDRIYLLSEFLFDGDIRSTIGEARNKINNSISRIGSSLEEAAKNGEDAPQDSLDELSDPMFIFDILKYPNLIIDSIYEQADRIKCMKGSEGYIIELLLAAHQELNEIYTPRFTDSDDNLVSQEDWNLLMNRFMKTYEVFTKNEILIDDDARNKGKTYLKNVDTLEKSSLERAEALIKYTEFAREIFESQIKSL